MKKQLLTISSILAITFLVIAGCKKEKNAPEPPAPTKTDLLVQSPWKFDHATASGIDISSQINACFKDNIASFTSNGNMTLDEGATVCSPSYANTYTWSFQNTESILHLSGPIFTGGSSDFTVVSLSATNLVVSQAMTVAPYGTVTVEVTFKH